MIHETDQDYHIRRAQAELDLAYRSECSKAMEAHLRLSSLHMQRVGWFRTVVRQPGLNRFAANRTAVCSPWHSEQTMAGEVEAISR